MLTTIQDQKMVKTYCNNFPNAYLENSHSKYSFRFKQTFEVGTEDKLCVVSLEVRLKFLAILASEIGLFNNLTLY